MASGTIPDRELLRRLYEFVLVDELAERGLAESSCPQIEHKRDHRRPLFVREAHHYGLLSFIQGVFEIGQESLFGLVIGPDKPFVDFGTAMADTYR